MKLRDLESALEDVEPFDDPVAELEQYPTSAHLAARMVHVAAANGDIEDKQVFDFGCGCCVLGIGAALAGAGSVVGVDIDQSALEIASKNVADMEVSGAVDLVRADVSTLWRPLSRDVEASSNARLSDCRSSGGVAGMVDTVVMNPPFGTKRKGIDICFLQIAVQHARGAVYSLHKSSTRNFVEKKARSWGTVPQVLAQMRFDIPAMYHFHQRASVDVEVDLWRLDCRERVPASLPDPRVYVSESPSLPLSAAGKRRVGKSSRRGHAKGHGRHGGGGKGKGH